MHQLEFEMMAHLHCSLHSLDETDLDSIFGLLGYLDRSSKKKHGKVRQIHGKKYVEKTADQITWL